MPGHSARTIARRSLVGVCVAGLIAFGAGFVATFVARPQIELVAQGFLRDEVTALARERLGPKAGALATLDDEARAISASLGVEAATLQAVVVSRLPEVVGRFLADLCNIECEEEKAAKAAENAAGVRRWLHEKIEDAKAKSTGLRQLVIGAYRGKLYALIDELRTFTGLNAALFALALLGLRVHRQDMLPLLLPTALLAGSTLCSVVLYVTAQNWFWTILLGDYMGAWYLAVVGVTLAFACDFTFFEARLTRALVEALPPALIPAC